MSDPVLIVLIIAITVIVALFLFRGNLKHFSFRANKEGVETDIKTRHNASEENTTATTTPAEKHSVNISGNKQVGKDNEISVAQNDVNVSDNTQVGANETIEVKEGKGKKKKK